MMERYIYERLKAQISTHRALHRLCVLKQQLTLQSGTSHRRTSVETKIFPCSTALFRKFSSIQPRIWSVSILAHRRLQVKKAWALHLAEQKQGTAAGEEADGGEEADIDPAAVSCFHMPLHAVHSP